MVRSYDYVIVGSGIAGLYTALLARNYGSVLILTKGSIDECNTKYAQGGIAAAIGKEDSPELHMQDTLAAGAGLCDPDAVRILVTEAPERIADLVRFGVPFDTLNGEVALTREAAHSVPRILHAGGDATGEQIEISLSRLARMSNVTLLEYCLVTEILVERGQVRGVRALDERSSTYEDFECRYLILATGGAGKLYKYTTNPDIATGDGVALAYRAGAEVVDMEFLQFHPTALRLPGVAPFLISEAVRGEGGILRNVDNYRFMPDYVPEAELAPRDVVARSIVQEMKRTGSERVFLDVTHLPSSKVTTRFPQIFRFCFDHGLDITKALIPVAPAAHYMMGGVKTNAWGETNIAGLFACGEVACTGVHGANRLASNSLMEVLVFGSRILERTRSKETAPGPDYAGDGAALCACPPPSPSLQVPPLRLTLLQSLMWDKVGMVRSGEGLKEALATLATWESCLGKPLDRPYYELTNMVLTGRIMAGAALAREESRGAHFRTDFPNVLPTWQRRLTFRKH
ncbi:MAG: L-aspartate oxidase [Chloroflexi bacterium]|nr:L-aspartate oxidase [Chloroflexota bacterium]